ncbi:MAG: FliH/SctL family protein [Pirellulales bacterium]
MASVIKSHEQQTGLRGAAFNFDDMTQHGEKYLAEVRRQAAQLLAEAQTQAERIRKQAEIDGLKAAQKQHHTKLEAEASKRMNDALPVLGTIVGEIEASREAWLSQWERSGIQLASRIAERILRRELERHPELPLTLMREALELATSGQTVRVSLNPADLTSLGPQAQQLLAELGRLGDAELIGDERIARGGCRVETRHGSIDQQIAAQLQRIEEELT